LSLLLQEDLTAKSTSFSNKVMEWFVFLPSSLSASNWTLFFSQFCFLPSIQFAKAISLEGHEGWIRGLAFCVTDTNQVLLASSSQDGNIRLWLVAPVVDASALTANLTQAMKSKLERDMKTRCFPSCLFCNSTN
jgi:WD40 repeat protein